MTGSDVSIGKTWKNVSIDLPHGRATDTQLVGSVYRKFLYVSWDDKGYIYPSYEVLAMKMNPKSLQHLCCNVIITATLGIPDRILQLHLPVHLKSFCNDAYK